MKRRDFIKLAGAGFVAACTNNTGENRSERHYSLNTPVEPFSMLDQNGKEITQADLKDKVTVVQFGFRWCAPRKLENGTFEDTGECQMMWDQMKEMQSQLRSARNTQLMVVNVDIVDGRPQSVDVLDMKSEADRREAIDGKWHWGSTKNRAQLDKIYSNFTGFLVERNGTVDPERKVNMPTEPQEKAEVPSINHSTFFYIVKDGNIVATHNYLEKDVVKNVVNEVKDIAAHMGKEKTH